MASGYSVERTLMERKASASNPVVCHPDGSMGGWQHASCAVLGPPNCRSGQSYTGKSPFWV